MRHHQSSIRNSDDGDDGDDRNDRDDRDDRDRSAGLDYDDYDAAECNGVLISGLLCRIASYVDKWSNRRRQFLPLGHRARVPRIRVDPRAHTFIFVSLDEFAGQRIHGPLGWG
jgi:hypothetical protein